MTDFLVWLARHHLRPKYSLLWLIAYGVCIFNFQYVGLWVVAWFVVAAIACTILEVWWNDYADDYSDLEE